MRRISRSGRRRWRAFGAAVPLAALAATCGCSTVGTGTRTVIRAHCAAPSAPGVGDPCAFLLSRYPGLVVTASGEEAERVALLDASGAPIPGAQSAAARRQSLDAFHAYLLGKYGDPGFLAAQLGLNLHDRGTTPAFLPIDVLSVVASTIAGFAAASSESTAEQAARKKEELHALFTNNADIAPYTAAHVVGGARVYSYYPRLSLDLSAQLLATSPADRLSYLGLLVRLHDCCKDGRVRFLDFSPKAADFAEFTRGQLTEAAQVQAQVARGRGRSQTTTQQEPEGGAKSTTDTSSLTPNLSGSLSEGYVTQLADAIERRTTGLTGGGRVFFADLRAIRQVRIGGTYNFDLMLEVPSTLSQGPGGIQVSLPVTQEIRGDVYLVGVVRHVYRRGHLGLITRIPESENDQVYEQVVLEAMPDQLLWKLAQDVWIDPPPAASNLPCKEEQP